jgi:vancomycin permeability regulator SanA
MKYIPPFKTFFRLRYAKMALLASLGIAVVLGSFLWLSTVLISPYSQYILSTDDGAALQSKHVPVGLVLGAGITKHGKPYRELQARLDVAAEAMKKGEIDKLILSGDNRFKKYDEPGAMKNYLLKTKHIAANRLQVDYAGRSTYESCERAAKVFGQTRLIIISARSHLPRAIYLCRHFGIEAYGLASGVEANNATRRELVARAKAVFNLYINGENTLLGPSIKL